MGQACVAFVASQLLEAVVSMPCWASSSINEPMSALAWQLGLTFVFSVVYKNN